MTLDSRIFFLRSELYLLNFCLSGKYRWEVWSVFCKALCNLSLYLIDRNTPAVIHLLPLCLYLLNLKNLKGKCLFLAATKQLYEWFRPSVRPSVRLSVTPFLLCSHHRIIMKFSGVITND